MEKYDCQLTNAERKKKKGKRKFAWNIGLIVISYASFITIKDNQCN